MTDTNTKIELLNSVESVTNCHRLKLEEINTDNMTILESIELLKMTAEKLMRDAKEAQQYQRKLDKWWADIDRRLQEKNFNINQVA